MTASGHLIPEHLRDSGEKMSFIDIQRERLNYVLAALDREAQQIQQQDSASTATATPRQGAPGAFDGSSYSPESGPTPRPPSGLSMLSALSKSRSEGDFEKIEADSGAEEDLTMRRRNVPSGGGGAGSWMPWGWGSCGDGHNEEQQHHQEHGSSTAREQ